MTDMMKPDEVGHAIVPVLACVLNQLCARNDRLPQKGVSKFHALRPPAISIKDYLHRVLKYAACSGECFVLALVYIDRLIQSNPTFVVNSLNIHRLLITSVMLAAKFFDDQYFNNAYYAKVGGVPCNEMNSLEVEFLFMTNFTLFVDTQTYTQYYTELCNHVNNPNNHCQCHQQKVPQLIVPELPVDSNVAEMKALCLQHGMPFDEDLTNATIISAAYPNAMNSSSSSSSSAVTDTADGMSESPAIQPRQLMSSNQQLVSAQAGNLPIVNSSAAAPNAAQAAAGMYSYGSQQPFGHGHAYSQYPNATYGHFPSATVGINAGGNYSTTTTTGSGNYGKQNYYGANSGGAAMQIPRRKDDDGVDEAAMMTGSPPVNAM